MDTPDKNLINNVIAGSATKKEAREVADWFSSTDEGQAYLSELINQEAQRLDAAGVSENSVHPVISQQILSEINTRIHQRTVRSMIFKVAAVVIPFILLAGLTFYTNSRVDLFGTTEYAEFHIPKGEKTRILFQDGSQAFLNSDTKIKYPRKFGLTNRKIQIEGEAYFKISTNSKRPFIVEINDTKVEVLGTSFNVKAYKEDHEMNIVLDKGKIVFDTPLKDYDMLPGQQAIYDKKTGKCSIITLEKSGEASLWVNGILSFRDTPMAEVLKTLNRMYNVEFKIEDPIVYKYTYTLTTSNTTLKNITKELEKITPVRFRINNDNIITVSSR